MESLRHACEEAPGEREPWFELARACHDLELWEEGLAAAERALSITQPPRHYLVSDEAWGARPADIASMCAWNLGMHERARRHVVAALAPDDARIAANAALLGIGGVRVVDPSSVERRAAECDQAAGYRKAQHSC